MGEGGLPAFLSIQPRPEEIRRSSIWLCSICKARNVPDVTIERLDLCLNEALANVLAHGTESIHSQPIEVSLQVEGGEDSGSATIEIRDGGIEFDPLAYIPQETALSLAEASIGGLGLTLIRHNTDTLEYTRSGKSNVLKLGFAWPRVDDRQP